ncbi:MAG TPA: response regulator [Vicinamibacterales bacterium]|nr:response regulator [Vicinamibacterales bacterium]
MSHTLLLADDSVTIQRVIELTFADEDIRVVAVSDGDQAIARLDSEPPDIVLADIGMPGKSGYEVAQYIKKSPKLAKIPVVLLTGAFEPIDQARAAEAGCDGILAKPFEPQLVITRVKELLAAGSMKPGKTGAPAPGAERNEGASAERVRGAGATDVSKDDYFDRLDAAFTSASAAPPAALVTASRLSRSGARNAPAAKKEDMDLPIAAPPPPAEGAVDLPLTPSAPLGSKPANPEPAAVAPAANDRSAARSSRGVENAAVPAEPVPIPALADAFAALLAAEQAEPLPPSVPAWPASGPPSDVIAEQISRRVLDQLSDKIVRETVTALVSEIAERLVREEIEKIKASVKL